MLFYCLSGKAEVRINEEKAELGEGQCLISEPAKLSLKTEKGVKLLGIQVQKQ